MPTRSLLGAGVDPLGRGRLRPPMNYAEALRGLRNPAAVYGQPAMQRIQAAGGLPREGLSWFLNHDDRDRRIIETGPGGAVRRAAPPSREPGLESSGGVAPLETAGVGLSQALLGLPGLSQPQSRRVAPRTAPSVAPPPAPRQSWHSVITGGSYGSEAERDAAESAFLRWLFPGEGGPGPGGDGSSGAGDGGNGLGGDGSGRGGGDW